MIYWRYWLVYVVSSLLIVFDCFDESVWFFKNCHRRVSQGYLPIYRNVERSCAQVNNMWHVELAVRSRVAAANGSFDLLNCPEGLVGRSVPRLLPVSAELIDCLPPLPCSPSLSARSSIPSPNLSSLARVFSVCMWSLPLLVRYISRIIHLLFKLLSSCAFYLYPCG